MDYMSDDIVKAFESMVVRTDFEDAFEVISGISDVVPPPSLINSIVFNILMENCEERIANQANSYLCDYWVLLPPKSRDFRYYYRETLQDKSGKFDNIWSVFSHLVESCFRHYKIFRGKKRASNPELVKYPNCDILIDFYTRMFMKFLSLENDLFEDDPDERFSILLEWINEVYKLKDSRPYPVLYSLHLLLDKKVNSDILCDASTDKFESIVNLILDKCPDVFNNVASTKEFFAKSNFSNAHVELRICQYKLHKLIFQEKLPFEMHTPLTLKTIMYNYFFYAKPQEESTKNTRRNSLVKNATNDPKQLKEIFLERSTKGDTILHDLCRKNRYGDLIEVLLSDSEKMPNARNETGNTPLHVACLCNCYYCVKFLLEDMNSDEKVDITATNNNGLTPLHCAAYADSMDITQVLLKHGGVKLVKLQDKFGKKAVNYAKSKNLKKLLANNDSIIQTSSCDSLPTNLNIDCLTVPAMKGKNEFSFFLNYLHMLLSNYLGKYNLFKSNKDGISKLSHKDCDCPHYLPTSSTVICDEDASVFECLPQLLDKFFACIQSDASNNEVEIRLDLLPLIVLRKILDR